MNSGLNGDGRYRVSVLPSARQQLIDIFAHADRVGRTTAIVAAARRIGRRLQVDPQDFGEITRRLDAAELKIRGGAIAPLFVYFAVHQFQSEVFVREFRALL